jgi:regulator of replication initiation timing
MTTTDHDSSLHDLLQRFTTLLDGAPAGAGEVVESARTAVAALLTRIDELESELAVLRADGARVAALEQQVTQAEQLVGTERELRLEADNLRHRNDELLAILDSVYRSTSWKVTQPMRRAVDLARHTAIDAVRQFRR